MYDFGVTLKKYRTAKKMTQKTLAIKVNISESMISRYEKNEVFPPLETLRALSGVLGVSLDELCGTETRGTASLYGLSEAQAAITKDLIDAFRNHNEAFKKQMTSEHYELLGRITAEFSK
ncbi:MAG: helix-turn-helix transcriptional regulator [Oscillospiraceae bacterium]|nr:helix-turn-helix transcriptional regulator [Oscillospiraceae bacterium]